MVTVGALCGEYIAPAPIHIKMNNKQQHPIIYACPPTQLNDQNELGYKMIIPLEGSITRNCDQCGMQVWVGPKQQMGIIKKPGPIRCFKCCTTQGVINIQSLGKEGMSYIKKEKNIK